jgi:Spondin_N
MRKYLISIGLVLAAGAAGATGQGLYEVTITNITPAQFFTPQLVVTHTRAVELFRLGEPASTPLAVLAEDGATGPLTDALLAHGRAVGQVKTIPGLLGPGKSASVTVEAGRNHELLSVAGMLIPTNDTFFAANGLRLPLFGSVTLSVPGYDAGSEANDQNCLNIPGPRCGGVGSSPGSNAGDEGFVHIGNGFHDLPADPAGGEVLKPQTYDWRNPVALITVKRIR